VDQRMFLKPPARGADKAVPERGSEDVPGGAAAKEVDKDVTGNIVNAVPTDVTWAADTPCLEVRQYQ
jgi:hypothetical protein